MSIIPSAATSNTSPSDRAAANFAADFAEATIKSRREDGLYRHVEFAAPKTMSRLILVTWPYNLLVAGSHGSYHFERYGNDTEDMFAWLRGIRVDPDRWASKLVNGADSVREYDRDRMEAQIKERVAEAVEDASAPDGLVAAVRIELLNSHLLDSRDTAFQLVSEFQHGVKYEAKCTCGTKVEHSYGAALTWRSIDHNLGDGHDVDIRQTAGFDFDDLSDWSVDKVSYHFAYQCHAASWAIAQYDAAKAATAPKQLKHADVAAALKAKPHEWDAVKVVQSEKSARVLAGHIRRAMSMAYHPARSFEAEYRNTDGEHRVYARYVGTTGGAE